MIVGFTGSRDFKDFVKFTEIMDDLLTRDMLPPITQIVVGDDPDGLDAMVLKFAKLHNIPWTVKVDT